MLILVRPLELSVRPGIPSYREKSVPFIRKVPIIRVFALLAGR